MTDEYSYFTDMTQISHFSLFILDIEFKEGETEHFVEVEVLYDGVREMREAFIVHLKPDENMVAETQVNTQVVCPVVCIQLRMIQKCQSINNLSCSEFMEVCCWRSNWKQSLCPDLLLFFGKFRSIESNQAFRLRKI